MAASFGYQTGSLPSPVSRSSGVGGDEHDGGGSVQFQEPERDVPENLEPVPHTHSARTWAEWKIPRSLLRVCFRIRNTAMVYSFLLLIFNAWLNVEIYREYIRSAIHQTTSRHAAQHSIQSLSDALYQRSLLQNLYIATLLGPLSDLLSRIVARNFFKLCLAKSMSHCSMAASLAQCTPSLNAYTLLILRGSGKWIPLIIALDMGEYIYSIRLWQYQSSQQMHISLTMYIKLAVVAWTAILCIFDICYLYTRRRFFFTKLPRHLHAVYICWDANQQFHWASPNNMLDLLEEHEDLHGEKFTSQESKEIRQRIAQWNLGEEELAFLGEEEEEDKIDSDADSGRNSAEEDEEKQQGRRLLASARINGEQFAAARPHAQLASNISKL